MTPTKAETLLRVAAHLGTEVVPPLVYWSVGAWRAERRALVTACLVALRGRRLAVRSAVRDEDAAAGGCAGRYRTELGVAPEPVALARAVDRVVAGYPRDGAVHHVLVQAMVEDACRSGVVATRDPATGAPYWVIELATGRATDVVTGGRGAVTRIAVRHDAPLPAIARAGCAAIVATVRAVERLFGTAAACEIELAERATGVVAVLQVRPLSTARGAQASPPDPVRARPRPARHLDRFAKRADRLAQQVARLQEPRPGLAGSSTILGLMPDWNPAELIGIHPAPLAAALFRLLVADTTWQEARAAMGYQPVPRTPLVRMLAGRPFVDTRASFNSFLPAGLAPATRAMLVDGWLARFREAPELHDRVELDVATTVRDADDARCRHSAPTLRPEERLVWVGALAALTTRAVTGPSLASALRSLTSARSRPAGSLADVLTALADCRVAAARPFAIVARHAFMAERMLRSLVARGALAPERLADFRRSLATVAGRFAADWRRVARASLPHAAFLARYGHLRPGAFDVTSLPYALRDLALRWSAPPEVARAVPFGLRSSERRAVAALLAEVGVVVDPAVLFDWAARAIVGREDAKFLFNRRLSATLEDLAAWGARQALAREDLAMLELADLARGARAGRIDHGMLRARIAAAQRRRQRERAIRLGAVVRGVEDLAVVWEPAALPSFVTDRTVVAPPATIDARAFERADVAGRIVCIESADPGFDWIFGCGVAGLVTRFGGGNSHMAVRCLELGVPAALGVGERAFERIAEAAVVELCCGERLVRDVGTDGTVGAACAL